jgi:hypothetical protein
MTSPTVDRRFGLVGNAAVKAPVTALAFGNVVLSGQQNIDGIGVLAVNASGKADRVLCIGQTSSVDNGIYDVSLNAWTRSVDANGQYDWTDGSMIFIQRGTTYGHTSWHLTTLDPITVGTTALTFELGIADSLLTASAAAVASAAAAAVSAGSAATSATGAAASLAAARALVAGGLTIPHFQPFTGTGPFVITGPPLMTSYMYSYINGAFDSTSFTAVGQVITYGGPFPLTIASKITHFYL